MGSGKPPVLVPKVTLASWYFRDMIGISAKFTAPPIAARYMNQNFGMDQQMAEVVAQCSLSLLAEPFQAAFHLYGFVLYNHPKATLSARVAEMKKGFWGAVQMRCARCIVPYCVGANINTTIRNVLNANVE